MKSLVRRNKHTKEASIVKDFTRGTSIAVAGLSVDEQLTAAGLNWNVELAPVEYTTSGGERKRASKHKVAYRSDTLEELDIYLTRQPWQNRDVVEAFNAFADNANIQLDRLGALKGGLYIYTVAKLPIELCPKGELEDRTEAYLMLEDSHENGRGMTAALYENRLVCTNGMRTAVKTSLRFIPHTSAFDKRKVAHILDSAMLALKDRQKEIDKLADTVVDKAEATLQLITAFGDPKKSVDDQPQIVQTCLNLFNGGAMGSEMLSAYNTAYGLLHSVTEYYNHHCGYSRGPEHEFQSLISGSRAKEMAKFQKQLVSVYCR